MSMDSVFHPQSRRWVSTPSGLAPSSSALASFRTSFLSPLLSLPMGTINEKKWRVREWTEEGLRRERERVRKLTFVEGGGGRRGKRGGGGGKRGGGGGKRGGRGGGGRGRKKKRGEEESEEEEGEEQEIDDELDLFAEYGIFDFSDEEELPFDLFGGSSNENDSLIPPDFKIHDGDADSDSNASDSSTRSHILTNEKEGRNLLTNGEEEMPNLLTNGEEECPNLGTNGEEEMPNLLTYGEEQAPNEETNERGEPQETLGSTNKRGESGNGSTNEKGENSGEKTEEFAHFFKYVRERGKELAQKMIKDDEEECVNVFMNEMTNPSKQFAFAKYAWLSSQTSPELSSCESEVMVENGLLRGSALPLIAGPIPESAIKSSGALAVHTGLSDEPGNYQWRMGHVVELLSSQLRGNLKSMREFENKGRVIKNPEFDDNEIILSIHAYQPSVYSEDNLTELKTVPEPVFGYEIEVLGSQSIDDLCSMFRCQADYFCRKEFKYPTLPASLSEAMEICHPHLAKVLEPNYAIFIKDTLYVKDASTANLEGLLAWTKRYENEGIGKIKISYALSTQLKNLELSFGYPYVYIHENSNCEHIFVFESLRLPRPIEVSKSSFPLYNKIGKFPIKYCTVDNHFLARWVVTGCNRLPHDPMFLCFECVETYLYERNNKKKRIGEFKLFPYFQLAHFL